MSFYQQLIYAVLFYPNHASPCIPFVHSPKRINELAADKDKEDFADRVFETLEELREAKDREVRPFAAGPALGGVAKWAVRSARDSRPCLVSRVTGPQEPRVDTRGAGLA